MFAIRTWDPLHLEMILCNVLEGSADVMAVGRNHPSLDGMVVVETGEGSDVVVVEAGLHRVAQPSSLPASTLHSQFLLSNGSASSSLPERPTSTWWYRASVVQAFFWQSMSAVLQPYIIGSSTYVINRHRPSLEGCGQRPLVPWT